jgi:hypothetical protein
MTVEAEPKAYTFLAFHGFHGFSCVRIRNEKTLLVGLETTRSTVEAWNPVRHRGAQVVVVMHKKKWKQSGLDLNEGK